MTGRAGVIVLILHTGRDCTELETVRDLWLGAGAFWVAGTRVE